MPRSRSTKRLGKAGSKVLKIAKILEHDPLNFNQIYERFNSSSGHSVSYPELSNLLFRYPFFEKIGTELSPTFLGDRKKVTIWQLSTRGVEALGQ